MESSHELTRRSFVQSAAGLMLSSGVLAGTKNETKDDYLATLS